jgi:hypothetical protein
MKMIICLAVVLCLLGCGPRLDEMTESQKCTARGGVMLKLENNDYVCVQILR